MQTHTGLQQLHRAAHDAQYGIVHGALAIREFAAHGDATCHVGSVVAVFRSDIHQDDVAGFAFVAVFDVVQDTRIEATADDGRVGKSA